MSLYSSPSSDFPFGSKGRRQIPHSTDKDLICDCCINKYLMSRKHPLQPYPQSESMMDLQSRLNSLSQGRINSKVQERIRISETLAKDPFYTVPSRKELLINTNEQANYYTGNNDYQRQRALNKYLTRIRSYNNYSLTEKPQVETYYKLYVDNYPTPNPYGTYSNKYVHGSNYLGELQKQIAEHEQIKKSQKESEALLLQIQQKDNEMYLKQMEEEKNKRKLLNDDFIKGNRELMNYKSASYLNEKKKQNEYDQNIIQSDQKAFDEEYEKKRYDDYMKKMQVKQELLKQMQENELMRKREKDYYRYDNNNNTYGLYDNEEKGSCNNCHRSYPVNVLNYRKQFEFIDK